MSFLSISAAAGDGSKMVDATTMLSMCNPVHFVLIKTDTSSETTLVSSYFLDWRTVLSSSSCKTCFAVELMGIGEHDWITVKSANVWNCIVLCVIALKSRK